MKRITSVILACIMIACLACFASAGEYSFFNSYSSDLTSEQMQELNDIAQQIVDDYDFVALIAEYGEQELDDLQGTADSIFYNNNYGYSDGLVLVLDVDHYRVQPYGKGMDVGFGTDSIGDAVYSAYSVTYDSDMYTGSYAMLKCVEGILDAFYNSDIGGTDIGGTETPTNSAATFDGVVTADGLVTDKANLLSAEEYDKLTQKLEEIKAETGFETAVLTLNSPDCTEYTIENYSISYFNENFSGDGAVLVMCMYERDWHFHFFGAADYKGSYSDNWITETVKKNLSSGKYYKAFETFADITNDIYTGTENTKKYKEFNWKSGIIFAVALGMLVSVIVTKKFKAELESVKMNANANEYTIPGSMNITAGNEVFLYKNVSRTAKPKNNSSSGRSSGGGGGSHSGGGKF